MKTKCVGVFPQLGTSNCVWGYKRWYLPFSSPLAGLLSFIWAPVPCPEESPQDWVPDAVLRVAGEGDGDGKASAPLNLLHPVEVLWSRGEKRHPACSGLHCLVGICIHEHEPATPEVLGVVREIEQRSVVKRAISHLWGKPKLPEITKFFILSLQDWADRSGGFF